MVTILEHLASNKARTFGFYICSVGYNLNWAMVTDLLECYKSRIKILTFLGGHHSSVVSSAPSILRPRVPIPSTQSMLFLKKILTFLPAPLPTYER